jgi:hypothetical protein
MRNAVGSLQRIQAQSADRLKQVPAFTAMLLYTATYPPPHGDQTEHIGTIWGQRAADGPSPPALCGSTVKVEERRMHPSFERCSSALADGFHAHTRIGC